LKFKKENVVTLATNK